MGILYWFITVVTRQYLAWAKNPTVVCQTRKHRSEESTSHLRLEDQQNGLKTQNQEGKPVTHKSGPKNQIDPEGNRGGETKRKTNANTS